MAERRYNFRFSLPEACVLLVSLLVASFLIFLFGVHVGREAQAHKAVQQGRAVRVPVALTDSEQASLAPPASESQPLNQKSASEASGTPKPPPPQVSTPTEPAKASAPAAATEKATQKPVAVPPGGASPTSEKKLAPRLSSAKGAWSVQVHATRHQSVVQNIVKDLQQQGYTPVVTRITRQGEVWYRVRVGHFANEEQARELVARFRREGTFPQAYPVSE